MSSARATRAATRVPRVPPPPPHTPSSSPPPEVVARQARADAGDGGGRPSLLCLVRRTPGSGRRHLLVRDNVQVAGVVREGIWSASASSREERRRWAATAMPSFLPVRSEVCVPPLTLSPLLVPAERGDSPPDMELGGCRLFVRDRGKPWSAGPARQR